VTKPFSFEAKKRRAYAEQGIDYLKDYVDSLIVIPNDKLLLLSTEKTTMIEALNLANEVLKDGVQGITEIIKGAGFINVDFADVKEVMTRQGVAHMGIGRGRGEGRVKEAVKAAVNSPLLDTTVSGAKYILLRVAGDENLGMLEYSEAADMIEQEADGEADVRIGMSIDNSLGDEIVITVIATGFTDYDSPEPREPRTVTSSTDKGFRPPADVPQDGFDINYDEEPQGAFDGGADYGEDEPSSEVTDMMFDEEVEGGDNPNTFAIPDFLRGE